MGEPVKASESTNKRLKGEEEEEGICAIREAAEQKKCDIRDIMCGMLV